MLAFFAAMIVALLFITYVPSLSLWLPVQTGQLKKTDVEQSNFMRAHPDSTLGEDDVEP